MFRAIHTKMLFITLLAATLFVASGYGPQDAGGVAIARAQTGVISRLIDMLAMVPATAAIPVEARYGIALSFADYAAIDQAREGVPAIADAAQFFQLSEAEDESLDVWFASRGRLASGHEEFSNSMLLPVIGERMPQVTGFDYFDVEASLVFGWAPFKSTIFGGDLDPDVIITAYTDWGYTTQEVYGLAMLCGWVGGCEDPNARDDTPSERDPETLRYTDENSLNHMANPFGGRLRRQLPVVPVPEYVMSSQSTEILENTVAAYQGEADSLLDLPAFRAAADALTGGDGSLLQVHFFHPFDVMVMPPPDFLSGMLAAAEDGTLSPDMIDDPAELLAQMGNLPVYELAIMADRQEGPDQLAVLGVVYSREEDAQTGAATLTERLRNFAMPFDLGQPVIEHAAIQATLDDPTVFQSESTGKWVAIATARYPLLGNEMEIEADLPPTSGRLYLWWFRAYLEGFFPPLWTDAILPEE